MSLTWSWSVSLLWSWLLPVSLLLPQTEGRGKEAKSENLSQDRTHFLHNKLAYHWVGLAARMDAMMC